MGNNFLLSAACLDKHCGVKQAALTLFDKCVKNWCSLTVDPGKGLGQDLVKELLWAGGKGSIQTLVKYIVEQDEAHCFTSLKVTLLCIF